MSRHYRSILGSQTAYNYIADTYSFSYAWSLNRKLSSASLSPFRVRRSSDNAEYDAQYTGNDLNVAALLSFIGSSDCFLVKIYNQGIGLFGDFSQVASSSQPRIATAGVLSVDSNGKLKAVFDGVNDSMTSGSIFHDTSIDVWDFHVCASSFFTFVRTPGAQTWGYRHQANAAVDTDYFDIVVGGTYVPANSSPRTAGPKLIVGQYKRNIGGGLKQYINGSMVAFGSTINGDFRTAGWQPVTIGMDAGATHSAMDFQESALHFGDLISVYTQIQTNINGHYDIY